MAATSGAKVEPNAELGVEQHFTLEDIAKKWELSRKTVERMFKNEPGVLLMGDKLKRMRIPQSVLQRVDRRLHAGRVGSTAAAKMGPKRAE